MNESVQKYLDRKLRRFKIKGKPEVNEKINEMMSVFNESPVDQEKVNNIYREIKKLLDSKHYSNDSKMSRKLTAQEYQNRKIFFKLSRLERQSEPEANADD